MVIAIIALLVAILMPSLAKSKALAKKATCALNQRNVGQQIVLYLTTYDGRFHGPMTGYMNSPAWVNLLLDHMFPGQPYKTWGDCINTSTAAPGGSTFADGLTWYSRYRDFASIFFCPTAPMSGSSFSFRSFGPGGVDACISSYDPPAATWGYLGKGKNPRHIPNPTNPPDGYSYLCELSALPRPGNSVLLAESLFHLWPVIDGNQLANLYGAVTDPYVVSTLFDHGGKSLNFLYVDGHVESSITPPYILDMGGYARFIEGG